MIKVAAATRVAVSGGYSFDRFRESRELSRRPCREMAVKQLARLVVCVYLPKKQHQTLNEALEIVVLVNRTLRVQRDVTKYLRPTERKRPQPKGGGGITKLRHQVSHLFFFYLFCICVSVSVSLFLLVLFCL